MNDSSTTPPQPASPIPPDDPTRDLAVARPNQDQALPHLGVVGDTYAGVGYREPRRMETVDGLLHVFAINLLAPYLLTALMTRPDRLIYLSSGMHRGGDPGLGDLQWTERRWNGAQAYSDSKLLDVVLAFAVARRWPDVLVNALEPGLVPTKLGGPGAPDDLTLAPRTQVWLAVSEHPEALVSGRYFYHQRPRETHAAVHDHTIQEELLVSCATLTGTPLT
jgi:NAD(P)-dependent dehydrogenase (short-subunit alcohol dehydrogenase family)